MSAVCPLLTTFITIGSQNDPREVTKLQTFLRNVEHADLVVNGVYDEETIAAVKNFQKLYAAIILQPYGTTVPTGNIYVTTQHVLNQVACQKEIPLSPQEVAAVAAVAAKYKTVMTENASASTVPVTMSTAAPTQSVGPVAVATNDDNNVDETPSIPVVVEDNVAAPIQASIISRFWSFIKALF